ncbi:MAG: penicillin-binding protein activator [Rhizobiaceae bacterium]
MIRKLGMKTATLKSSVVKRGMVFASLVALLSLTACQSSNLGLGNLKDENGERILSANPKGEVFGQGKVRVALLLPKSAAGNAAKVANEIRNGALLAMSDFGNDVLQLVIKDTRGQAAPAQSAAGEAAREGTSAIIGPLFSGNVSAASGISQPADMAMFAFSTDTSVARRGVYLLSFTPQGDVRRMITFAASQGSKSVLAFLPNNAEGALREAVLREVAGTSQMDVNVVKYDRTAESIRTAIGATTLQFDKSDSLYIPDGGQVPSIILTSLRDLGLTIKDKQILGSGNWESANIASPEFANALFPKRDISNFETFSQRYQAAYGSEPGVQAALGYDAVTLVSELIRQNGKNAFASSVVENKRGFSGTNGLFRLHSDGTTERGLAIYQVREGKAELIAPAPGSFRSVNRFGN